MHEFAMLRAIELSRRGYPLQTHTWAVCWLKTESPSQKVGTITTVGRMPRWSL
jgi:hypothetical protein